MPYIATANTTQVAFRHIHPIHPIYSTRATILILNRCRCSTLPRHRQPGHRAAVTAMAASDGAAGRAAIDEAFKSYKKGFPDVRDISAAELNALQQDSSTKLMLVDIRTPEEQQVHVSGFTCILTCAGGLSLRTACSMWFNGGMVVRTSSMPAIDGLVCVCCRSQCYLALCHSRRLSSGSLSRTRAQ
jgi:hypothetical protein